MHNAATAREFHLKCGLQFTSSSIYSLLDLHQQPKLNYRWRTRQSLSWSETSFPDAVIPVRPTETNQSDVALACLRQSEESGGGRLRSASLCI